MAVEHGFLGQVKIDDHAGALQTISEHCTNADLNQSTETSDSTGFGAHHKSSLSGQSDATLSVQGNWHSDVGAVMFGRGRGAEMRSFEYSQTSTGGEPNSTGEAIITGRSLTISKSDTIKFGLECQVSGDITQGTVA